MCPECKKNGIRIPYPADRLLIRPGEVIIYNDLIRMALQSFARPGIYQGILDGDDFSEMFHIPMFSISADPSLRSG